MGIRMITPPGDIKRELQLGFEGINRAIKNIMDYVGLQFVRDARSSLNIDTGAFPAYHRMTKSEMAKGKSQPQRGDYMDQTANLRSSIGYFIYRDGQLVSKSVRGENREGVSAALSFVENVPKKPGYQLIAVAGMDYASYVESHGFNVISSQGTMMQVNLDERIRAFANKKGINLKDYAEMSTATVMI